MAVASIPMLVLSLVAVSILKALGFVDWLTLALSPLLAALKIDLILILPTLAGGTAMLGVMEDMRRTGQISTELINNSAGWLIHPLDVPGIAILVTARRHIASVWKPAALGGLVGIAVRSAGHIIF